MNRDRPVINVGSAKKPVYVGMEVCEVIYGQIYKRKLDGNQTTAMTEEAVATNLQTKHLIMHHGFENVGLSNSNQRLVMMALLSINDMRG